MIATENIFARTITSLVDKVIDGLKLHNNKMEAMAIISKHLHLKTPQPIYRWMAGEVVPWKTEKIVSQLEELLPKPKNTNTNNTNEELAELRKTVLDLQEKVELLTKKLQMYQNSNSPGEIILGKGKLTFRLDNIENF